MQHNTIRFITTKSVFYSHHVVPFFGYVATKRSFLLASYESPLMKPSTGNPAGMRYDPWSGCDVYDGRTSPPPVAATVSGAWDIIGCCCREERIRSTSPLLSLVLQGCR